MRRFSSRIQKQIRNRKNYFPYPIYQGQHKVLPHHPVPPHIIKPKYVTDKNPIFGIYQGTPIKHDHEAIQKLKKAAKIASNTLFAASKFVKAGKTCEQIDKFVHDHIINQGAYPTPIGFMHFPKSVCISVNEVIVHGIPSQLMLRNGDSLNIDVTVFIDGYHGDTNLTVEVGQVDPDIKKVIQTTQKALYEAIKICKPGQKINKIGKTIQQFARSHNCYVCNYFNGHGVGQLLHMPPTISHTFEPYYQEVMVPGNVFTIEPIISLFQILQVQQWQDNFTIISRNNPNAQFEHTILITQTGYQVLTLRQGQKII